MTSKKAAQDGFGDWINEEGGMKKAANLGFQGNKWPTAEKLKEMSKQASADVARTSIQFLDPAYFDPILFFIQHRDRKELNFRLRYYAQYHPIVGNVLSLHSEFPLSDFRLQCSDSSVQRSFEDMSQRIDLLSLMKYTLKDYFMLGEAFPYGRWSETDKCWDYFTLFPPEKIELKSTYVTPNPIVILQVDDQLKTVVNSADEVNQKITEMMDPAIVEKIKSSNYIPIPSHQISHFSNKVSMTDLRGTSIVLRCLKDLLYEDKLRLLQTTFADRHMFPLKIFKLGNPQTGWIPNKSHFEALRSLLVNASNDPDFNLIFHMGLQVEYVGTKDKIANLIPEFDFVQKRLLAGLFANEALIHGQGATFANANVSVRVLMHRYLTIRSQLENMVNNKIFLPVAKARGYYIADKTGNSGKEAVNRSGKYYIPDVPKMRWMKLNLIDDTSQKNFIMRLLDKNVVPHKLIAEIFDLEENDLLHQLKKQQGTVVDPAYNKAREMAIADEDIRKQVLAGKPTSEWKFGEKPSDKKKPKSPRDNAKGDVTSPMPSPEESAAAPEAPGPTAPPAPAAPSTEPET